MAQWHNGQSKPGEAVDIKYNWGMTNHCLYLNGASEIDRLPFPLLFRNHMYYGRTRVTRLTGRVKKFDIFYQFRLYMYTSVKNGQTRRWPVRCLLLCPCLPPPLGGGIKRWCASDVDMGVTPVLKIRLTWDFSDSLLHSSRKNNFQLTWKISDSLFRLEWL